MNNKAKIVNKFGKDRATAESLFTDVASYAFGEMVIDNTTVLPSILIKDNNMKTHAIHGVAVTGNAGTTEGDVKVAEENKNGEKLYTVTHTPVKLTKTEDTGFDSDEDIKVVTGIEANGLGHVTNVSTGSLKPRFDEIQEQLENVGIKEDIIIAGGPLADIAIEAYPGGILPAGTDLQELFSSLLCVEIYPTPVANTSSVKYSLNVSAPSVTGSKASGSLVEVGASVTVNSLTAASVTVSKTEPRVATFEHGYSETIDGEVVSATTISTTFTAGQKDGEVYSLSASASGFKGTVPSSVSNASASACVLPSATFTASLGTNTYSVTETGPKYTYSHSGISSYYVVSNLKKRSEDHKSPAIAALAETDTNTPTSTKSYNVVGVYPVYSNISGGAFTEEADTKLALQTSATFTFTSVPGEVGSYPFKFDFPSTKTISKFEIQDPSGKWASFSAAYTTDTTVEKTINGTTYTYNRLITDGTQGAGNTYRITLSKALNQ